MQRFKSKALPEQPAHEAKRKALAEVKQSAAGVLSKNSRDRLRKIESKYFGETEDELASDLSGADSELDQDDDDGADDGSSGDSSGEDASMESSDEAPDEVGTVSMCSMRRKLEKQKSCAPDTKSKKQKVIESVDEDDSESLGSSDSDRTDEGEPSSDNENIDDDGLDDLLNESDSDESKFEDDSNDSNGSGGAEKPKLWEDIYGRKRDQDGNVIDETTSSNGETKYVPPHMRARLAAAVAASDVAADAVEMDPKRREKLLRLKKLLKGNLNRLSETNMHKIATDIDNLYMQNSRHDMNNTMSTLIVDALITNVLAPERMVMEHMMLIAVLHANVGTEVGAHMLEVLIDRFHVMFRNGIEQYDVEDKTLDNVVLILCHMYTFKVSVNGTEECTLHSTRKNYCHNYDIIRL